MKWVIINSPTKVVILGYTKFSDTQVCLLETSGRNRLVTLFFFSTKHILCFMSWTNHEAIRIGITFQRVGPIPPNQAHGCFRQDFTQRIIMTVWQYDNSDQFDTDLCLERCKKCVCVWFMPRKMQEMVYRHIYVYIYMSVYIYIYTYIQMYTCTDTCHMHMLFWDLFCFFLAETRQAWRWLGHRRVGEPWVVPWWWDGRGAPINVGYWLV